MSFLCHDFLLSFANIREKQDTWDKIGLWYSNMAPLSHSNNPALKRFCACANMVVDVLLIKEYLLM